jgi:periplasmic protein TonB
MIERSTSIRNDLALGTSGKENVQRQIEGERHRTEPDRMALEAASALLGAVKPAKAHNEAVPARSGRADATLAGIVAIKPGKGGAEEPSQNAQAGELIGKLVLPPLCPAQRRRRVAFKAAAVVSVLLHAASLAAFLNWHGAETGAIEQPSEAISVEIVESRTLEALQPKQAPEPTPSPQALAPTPGAPEATDAAVAKPNPAPELEITAKEPVTGPEAREEVKQTAREEMHRKSETPPVPVQGPAEVMPEPPKTRVADEEAEAKRKEQRQVEKKKAAERAPKGGPISKSNAGKGTGGERASASTGSIMSYAAFVRARVAGNKPSGGGSNGTVVVTFRVTAAGGLSSVSVTRSSGNSALDQLAVSAVRGAAPFPTPPAGATPAQLFFAIPFHFQ